MNKTMTMKRSSSLDSIYLSAHDADADIEANEERKDGEEGKDNFLLSRSKMLGQSMVNNIISCGKILLSPMAGQLAAS